MVTKINKWEIYFCNLDPVRGSEQQGIRPAIIVSNDSVNHNIPVSTVIPLSKLNENDKIYPTELCLPKEITGLNKDSVAMLQQIRSISHLRFVNKAGIITDNEYREKILEAIKLYFEF